MSVGESAVINNAEATFLGHPRGLSFIVFTEAWERFSFYGMQALLVLYMAGHLLQPGAAENVIGFAGFRAVLESVFGSLSIQALATQIFGLYIGLVYFTPILGGLAGDLLLGRKGAVIAGGVLMAVGHFLMAFEAAFLFALSALILGSGLLKGNLAAQVGNLYQKDDQRRDTAFTLYNVSINVGAFVAPLVCGTLGELYGWHYGFGAAGIGMLVGLVVYLSGLHYLLVETKMDKEHRPRLQAGDGKIIAALAGVFIVASMYWTAQSQVWNTYPLWIKDRVDRDVLGMTVPVTWFQSIDTLAVLLLAPLVMWFWRRQRQRGIEPRDLRKIAIGCIVFAGACIWLSVGEMLTAGTEREEVPILWPTVFHFICGIGFLYVGPIMLALVSRSAPAAVNAMMVGAYYLSIFAGGTVSGWLGRYYEVLSSSTFWLMHAGIVAMGTLLIVVFHKPLNRILKIEGG